ncbi:three-helix bundle dimerization domain-containing protein [Phycicoccus flavus]|uniref:three-helix bundle dimerization domain-containing protein n=1 Tax=Phycicoccus flavus TaxID=2502783 RepID=UPI000FEBFCB9|nr:hypothetical protein [Phycicoccus flavus]NHA68437.1 hypothetical protein [Phycicoccus flavus]
MTDAFHPGTIDVVRQRLERRFPDLDPAVVEAAVRLAVRTYTTSNRAVSARTVELAARDRLSFADRPTPTEVRPGA